MPEIFPISTLEKVVPGFASISIKTFFSELLIFFNFLFKYTVILFKSISALPTLCFDFKRAYNLDIRIARIFNTYGPRMAVNDGRVISNFIVQALKGDSITIYGDGSQTRSFCYVDDLIDGLILLMNSNKSGPINIGNPDEFKIKELAEMILKKLNSNSELIYLPLPEDDPLQRKPVIEKAKHLLDWYPKVKLEKGLENTINYFKENIWSFKLI